MEVGETVFPLHFVHPELDLAEGMVFVVLEVGEGDFEDAAFQSVVGVLETGCAVDEGFADSVLRVRHGIDCVKTRDCHILALAGEGGGCFDREPVFPCEGVDGSLLETFLAL